MAKIEMDVSEWQLMKDKEKLLEDALKREKELSGEIEKLNKEKIEILKSNEKVVTIEERRATVETVFTYHSVHGILQRVKDYFSRSSSYIDHDRYGHTKSMVDGEMMLAGYGNGDLHNMLDMFFEKKTNEIISEPIITSRGLDEVRNDIRIEEFNKLEQRVKDDLASYRKLTIDYDNLSKENKKSKAEIKVLNSEVKRINDQSEKLSEYWTDLSNYKARMKVFMALLTDGIDKLGVFSIKTFKSNMTKVIKDWEEIDEKQRQSKILLGQAKEQVRKERNYV